MAVIYQVVYAAVSTPILRFLRVITLLFLIKTAGITQCDNSNCTFECASGATGHFDYHIEAVKYKRATLLKGNTLDFSDVAPENGFLRLKINNIGWSGGTGKISIRDNLFVPHSEVFSAWKKKNTGPDAMEIMFSLNPSIIDREQAWIDLEFVPVDNAGNDCRDTGRYRIKKRFTFIPPVPGLVPAFTDDPGFTPVERITRLSVILKKNPTDAHIKTQLTDACNAELDKALAFGDKQERKNALGRFQDELDGCKQCDAGFGVRLQKESDKVEAEILSEKNGTAQKDSSAKPIQTGKGGQPEPPPPDDEKAWEAANKDGGSEDAYNKYTDDFPNGKHVAEAKQKIQEIALADQNASTELLQDLKNAGNDCVRKVAACDRYLKREPVGHFTRKRNDASRDKKNLVQSCGFTSLTGESTGNEGELRLTYFNKDVRNRKDIVLHIRRNGQEMTLGQDIFADTLAASGIAGQFEWLLRELEGGETEVIAGADGKTIAETFFLPKRPSRLLYENGKIHIIGGEEPLYIWIFHNNTLQKNKPKLDSRWIDFQNSEHFQSNGQYKVIVVDYTDAKIGELAHPQLPEKGRSFRALKVLTLLLGVAALALLILYWKKLPGLIRRPRSGAQPRPVAPPPSPAAVSVQRTPPAAGNSAPPIRPKIILKREIPRTPSMPPSSTENAAPLQPIKQIPTDQISGASPVKRLFPSIPDPSLYRAFDLQSLWPDTGVVTLFLSEHIIMQLRQNIRSEGDADAVTPIGGFLLGRSAPHGGGYAVLVEQYIGVPLQQNANQQPEFGPDAFGLLDSNRHLFPQLQCVGWWQVNVAPGAGLTDTERRMHTQYFKEPYQLAVRIARKRRIANWIVHTLRADGQLNDGGDGGWLIWDN